MPIHREASRAAGREGSRSRSRASGVYAAHHSGSQAPRSGTSGRQGNTKESQAHRIQHGSGLRVNSATVVRNQPAASSIGSHESLAGISELVQNSIEPIVEIIMAVDLRDGQTMGCAFFQTENGALSLCTDVPMAELDVLEQLLAQIEPTTVLAPGRAPETLLAFLEERSAATDDSGSHGLRFILRAMSSSEFSTKTAHDRLIALQRDQPTTIETSWSESSLNNVGVNVDAAMNEGSRNMRLIKCGTSIDLDSQVSVGCAGAVLNEINRRRSAECLPDGSEIGPSFEVISLDMFSLHDSVYITQETLLALQIIQSEQHPNSKISGGVQSNSGSKESLSVYGLLHHFAGTPQGRASLRRLLLRPTQDMRIITERQDFIALFTHPENVEQTRHASKTLRKIGNARRVIAQLQRGAESPSTGQSDSRGAWSILRRFVTYTLRLREVILSIEGYTNVAFLLEVVECIEPATIASVGSMIEKTIDFDESKERQRSCVRAGVDSQLDQLKRLYDGMSSLLTQVVDHVRGVSPEWARKYVRSCIFLPQLGFLTVVELDPGTGNGKFEGEGGGGTEVWEKIFSSDGFVCYKNRFMKELDDQYGDLYCEIGDREVEIIHDLARRVLEHEEMLSTISDLCGHFDAMLALALGAQKYNWNRPQISDDTEVCIEGGRHPLQELVVPCFIPNDCHISASQGMSRDAQIFAPKALVLTGPNHSGKSVYLKQIAMILYLAQVGSYVPAERAVLGITDKIFTRISSRESVSRVESAFAMDLKQIAQSMRGATMRSLVIVDEFGKGTNSDDGAGLLTALLDHFLRMGRDCPKILLATHFHEVFDGGYLDHHIHLQVAHMEVESDRNSEQDEDHLTYLFKLAPGHSSSSFGCRCAALNGVPGAVVRRAEAISQMIARHEDLIAACSRLSMEEEEILERAEGAARRFLEEDIELFEPQEQASASQGWPASEGMSMKELFDRVLDESVVLPPQ